MFEPVVPATEGGQWPMTFAIAMGVRKGAPQFQAAIEKILAHEQPAIHQILADYDVPELPLRP